jgi:hypothetical protein
MVPHVTVHIDECVAAPSSGFARTVARKVIDCVLTMQAIFSLSRLQNG